MIRKRGIDLVVFQSTALKLGYLNRLNIIKERKSMSGGRTNFQLPRWRSLSESHNMKSVKDAISPAAAGMGKPLNSFSAPAWFAATTLKRASLRAPQARYTKAITQPVRGTS